MATWTPQTKSSATLTNDTYSGGPWKYNHSTLTYNSLLLLSKPVYYNAVGSASTWTPQTKSSATITNQSKN